MAPSKSIVDPAVHRQLAADLFNKTWNLMDKTSRTVNEDALMIHMAHASRYHWDVVGNSVNFARGEWQISRAYILVKRFEPAIYHALTSLNWCQQNDLGPFDLGFAHEAIARAYALSRQDAQRDAHITLARSAADTIEDLSDKNWLMKNIDTVTSQTIPVWE